MAKPRKKTELKTQTTLIAKLKAMSVMSIAIWSSIALHLVILSIHFEPELKKFRDNLPVLEVVLVNAKTQAKPENTEVYAQANLDRGGNTELDRKMKTALPALKQQKAEFTAKPRAITKKAAKASKQAAEQVRKQKNVAELEKQAQALMTQINAANTVESKQTQKATAKEADADDQETPNKKLNLADITATALEMDRLEAIISKQQDEYQIRPKRKFIGARTKEYRYALYVESWRQKVEKVGNLNYPEAAKNLKLYGQLQLTVSIKADGSIESIEINRSSGHKVLDAAAIHIVEMGAPYAHFPDDVRKEIDVLSITRTWTFTKEDNLATE
ncbi:MAG: TonB family protein [Methylotenera sp.]|nr:TonB family protein [Methylotenera sp.]MDP1755355.1 TonB family protein [Methylotenera sp.]MDP1959642.1 TonB family protein [Methylotenera sp.]MDP3207495.1 TonB family protein [Methylotenera sp.]MDP3303498.1 TonB family protein [Methylotenera sp.]